MSFYDAFDPTGAAPLPSDLRVQQSLNDEVSQVVGQLSSFWSGFRKQVRSPHCVCDPFGSQSASGGPLLRA